ncbi:single-stranded DNA-binding protein [Serinicoccus kebangsaanensis]|uniref:single-stranded DNA-binding protein n=1 Tax=Serinicoccus kebangsaanensis TaxID=2602069 RepID=UPI00124C91CE|nr:single-stranded DNA-binding protein [Serinicoccus kebangsaanensis]
MMNEPTITVSGNLTRDPERKTSSTSGKPFAVVPIAVNRRRFDAAQDSWITSDTMYVDLLCFRNTGATALASFRKGDPVIAHGRLSLRDWKTDSAAGTTAVVDVDSIGHDVSRGVSRFSKGWVGYDGERIDGHDPTPPSALSGGLVGAADQRAAGGVGGVGGDTGGGTGGQVATEELAPDEAAAQQSTHGDIDADADGVVQDDEQADGVLARSA